MSIDGLEYGMKESKTYERGRSRGMNNVVRLRRLPWYKPVSLPREAPCDKYRDWGRSIRI